MAMGEARGREEVDAKTSRETSGRKRDEARACVGGGIYTGGSRKDSLTIHDISSHKYEESIFNLASTKTDNKQAISQSNQS